MSSVGFSPAVRRLPLTRITVDPALQVRLKGLDREHVLALQENPDAWPPLVVVERDGHFLLVDGFHRLAAAQALGLKDVPVDVRPLPADRDPRFLAFSINAAHGRSLTLPDRRAEAMRFLRAEPDTSNLEVARHTALSPTTIAKLRERLEADSEIPGGERRVNRRGVAYTPPSGRQRGELPPDNEPVADLFFTSAERREQRRLGRFFVRLATALDDGWAFDSWQDAADAAAACRVALGDQEAADLGERLGPAARNVVDVAVLLGYEDGGD